MADIEIDCRKCVNCNTVEARCEVYGYNPVKVVAACAADGFKHYRLRIKEIHAEERTTG